VDAVAVEALDAVVRCRSTLDGTAIPADVAALLEWPGSPRGRDHDDSVPFEDQQGTESS
jgi:hypothetical protein